MLTAIIIGNCAIALLCFGLTWRIVRFNRYLTQLNQDLNRWTVLLETTLREQTLALTAGRTSLHQWQLIYLRWQLQQRRLRQIASVLQFVWRTSRWSFLARR